MGSTVIFVLIVTLSLAYSLEMKGRSRGHLSRDPAQDKTKKNPFAHLFRNRQQQQQHQRKKIEVLGYEVANYKNLTQTTKSTTMPTTTTEALTTEKPESKLIPPGAPIPDFDFGIVGDNSNGRFFIISGDQDPKIVVKDSGDGRDQLAWRSQSLGAVTIKSDMLLVVRGQASICCKSGMNCPRRSNGSCNCRNLSESDPCDVDQDKVSSEYLIMAERFAMRHAHSRYFVDLTKGGAFSSGLLPGAKIVRRDPAADLRRVVGEAIGAVYRRDREGQVQLGKEA